MGAPARRRRAARLRTARGRLSRGVFPPPPGGSSRAPRRVPHPAGLRQMLKLMFMPFRLAGGIVAGVCSRRSCSKGSGAGSTRARARPRVPRDRDLEADRRAGARGGRLQGRPGGRRPRDARRVPAPDGPLAGREGPEARARARLIGGQARRRYVLPRRRRWPAPAPVPARPGGFPRAPGSNTTRSSLLTGARSRSCAKGSREELKAATGQDKLPALKLPDGTV